MIYKKALLYKSYSKKEDPVETVTVLPIGTVADDDGSYIAISVIRKNGEVIEVEHDRIRFIDLDKET